MSKIAKFSRLSAAERRLAIEAAILLGLARAAVIALPFRWVASVLGRQNNELESVGDSESTSMTEIMRIAWTVKLISRYTPWRSNCLAKAVAGRLMLRRRQITSTLYFGMTKNSEGQLEAHAWLRSGNMTLTGGSNLDRYAIVAVFTD